MTTWCLAVGNDGQTNQVMTETLSQGRWTAGHTSFSGETWPTSVSCPASGICAMTTETTGGTFTEMLSGGKWRLISGEARTGVLPNAVSCATAANCTAVGADLQWRVATLAKGHWSTTTIPAPKGDDPGMSLISITAPHRRSASPPATTQ